MKFGKSIGTEQDGNLGLHYVDYKLLKKRIKDVVVQLQARELAQALDANKGFEEELVCEIQKVNACFGQRQQELLVKTADLSEVLQSLHKECPGADRPDALRRLVDILGEVDQLRKYAVWNAVAVVKILKKRRKQTNFGLEDTAAERAGWLSRQTFFSGSDFAELHAAIESLGHMLVMSELTPAGVAAAGSGAAGEEGGSSSSAHRLQDREMQQCPICLDTISDMVELDCNHRFCWKCFVLGPIAFQPGEYRITQCPICRRDTSKEDQDPSERAPQSCDVAVPSSEGVLTRFLHTYFPQEPHRPPSPSQGGGDDDDDGDIRDVVGELVKAIIVDAPWGQRSSNSLGSSSSAAGSSSDFQPVRDFFHTLPPCKPQDKQIEAAQKLQWLQLASTGDPLALDGDMYCSLCSEPLLMEAVVTTPCKHHFHRVCVGRLEFPQCPLCTQELPFRWFVPREHPCAEHGFRVVAMHDYTPVFPGGPCKQHGGYPLHQPPPMVLHGPQKLTMKSYLHKVLVPPTARHEPPTPAAGCQVQEEEEDGSSSSSSESGTEDSQGRRASNSRYKARDFAWSAVGRMPMCDPSQFRGRPEPQLQIPRVQAPANQLASLQHPQQRPQLPQLYQPGPVYGSSQAQTGQTTGRGEDRPRSSSDLSGRCPTVLLIGDHL